MAGGHTKFKGVSRIGENLLCEQLKHNLISYLNYAFLEVGGFFNITIPTSGAYGGTQSRLRLVKDPNYTDGQVWEGFRGNWVYETGLDISVQPIRVSGVYVNNAFKPQSGVGDYAHVIDYPRGRIIFNSAISTTSTVTCNFSPRWVNVSEAESPWFRQIQFRSNRVDSADFLQVASGDWSQLIQNRVQLPAVLVEVVPSRTLSPLSLGGGQKVRQDITFHILAENSTDRNQIFDILTYQKNKQLYLYNINDIPVGKAPLDSNGSPQVSGLYYPMLVEASGEGGYFWNECNINEVFGNEMFEYHPNLYGAQVRYTVQIEMHGL